MSVRNAIVLFLAISTISLLVACGTSSIPTATPPPTGTFSNSDLSGTYVFSVTGTDENGDPYAIVGQVTANGSGGNGSGGITAGTIDIVDPDDTALTPTTGFGATVNPNGFYTVGVDGRGQMTIGTSSANPFGGNMTFDFVLANSTQGLITEFDGNATGSGTLDLQTASLTQSSLTGSYAFSFSGEGPSGSPFATVGDFTIGNSSGTISGLEDFNSDSIAYPDYALSGQVILGPSSTPSTQLTTTTGFGVDGTVLFDVYAIDATHLKFIEADGAGTLSGDAFSQTSAVVPVGTLAFTLSGFYPANTEAPFAAGGLMVTDNQGDITSSSSEDFNEGGAILTSTSPVPFSGSYTNVPAGSGRFTLSNLSGFTPGPDAVYAAYPSSGGLLLLEIDDLGVGITSGAAYLQSSTSFGAASQGFGLNLTGINLGEATESEEEVDDIAEFTAAGTGGTCDTAGDVICGIIDENYDPDGAPNPDLAFSSGTYGSITTGRYGLSAADGNSTNSTLNGGFNVVFYTVDGTSFPFMEMDSGQVATGVFLLQTSSASSSAAKQHMFIPRPLVKSHSSKRQKQK